jgi:ABC-type nitrate/sulfonate/bicarbonate transport system substrate-binding protein
MEIAMHRRCLLLIAVPAGLIGAVAALGSFTQVMAQGAKLAKVTLRLDWKPGAQHAPFYYAKAKGYYEAEGLDVSIIPGSGSSDSVKLLGAHSVDVALVDGLVMVQAAEQEVPAKSVAAYYQRTPIVLISPADKPITDPKQLLGDVKLGSKKGSATYQGLLALLAANNIKPEQVHLADIGFGVQPLLVHQVDALMGFVMNEPIEAENGGMKVHNLLIADHGVHAYGLTIASNDRFMKDHPDELKAFLRATIKGMDGASTDKTAAVDAITKEVSEIDVPHELKVLDQTIPFWTGDDTRAHGIGWQTDAAWQQTIDTAKQLGLVETAPKISAVYTDDFLTK